MLVSVIFQTYLLYTFVGSFICQEIILPDLIFVKFVKRNYYVDGIFLGIDWHTYLQLGVHYVDIRHKLKPTQLFQGCSYLKNFNL
jgi:hypothetical protein